MREKLIDLEIAAVAATNNGMVKNSAELRSGAREDILDVLRKPLI